MAYPMRYTRTNFERERLKESIRKSLSWVVFAFLITTNMITAIGLIQARHYNAAGVCDGR